MSLLPDLQLEWDVDELSDHWPNRLDHRFLLNRLAELTVETALAGGAARVLDVAAAEAEHAIEMSRRGVRVVALEPSPIMLARARARAPPAAAPR
jgi:SAM-dependent methyltransferase